MLLFWDACTAHTYTHFYLVLAFIAKLCQIAQKVSEMATLPAAIIFRSAKFAKIQVCKKYPIIFNLLFAVTLLC